MSQTTQPSAARHGRLGRFARYGAYFLAADVILSGIAALVVAR